MRVRDAFCGRGSLAALALSSLLATAACGAEDEFQEPVPLFEEAPIEYPLPLWDEGIEGTTLLRVRVTETGVVDSTVVLESSGHDAFDSAAVRGGRRLRFEPAVRNGEPVLVWAHVPVHFSLSGEADAEAAPAAGPVTAADSGVVASPDGVAGEDEVGGARP